MRTARLLTIRMVANTRCQQGGFVKELPFDKFGKSRLNSQMAIQRLFVTKLPFSRILQIWQMVIRFKKSSNYHSANYSQTQTELQLFSYTPRLENPGFETVTVWGFGVGASGKILQNS